MGAGFAAQTPGTGSRYPIPGAHGFRSVDLDARVPT